MSDGKSVRIDKFLWAMRLYKTRGIATDACHMGRISVNGAPVKPSHPVVENDLLTIRKPPVIYSFRVVAAIENRQPAKLVGNYISDVTPENEKAKLGIRTTAPIGFRKKGTGRPTKKERRVIDKWQGDFNTEP